MLITKSNGGIWIIVLVSLIHSNSITQLIDAKSVPNWHEQEHSHAKITKTPNILQNLDNINHLQPP